MVRQQTERELRAFSRHTPMMFPLFIAALFAVAYGLGRLVGIPCAWLQRPHIDRTIDRELAARDLGAWLSQRDAEVRGDQRQRPPAPP